MRSVLADTSRALLILAGAALIWAPAAGAEPDPGQECQQEQQATSDQQQCQESGLNTPDLPDLPENDNNDASQERGNCWLVNGVPRYSAPGVAPAPAGPFDVVTVCPEDLQ